MILDLFPPVVLSHPGDRAHSLKTFLKDANTQLEQSRENEKVSMCLTFSLHAVHHTFHNLI
jgi:hypothetical protein